MSLTDYVRRIAQRWRVIAVTVGVLVAVATTITFLMTPSYESKARVFVSNSGEIEDLGTQMAAGVYAQQKVLSYAAVATSQKMAEAVIDDLDLAIAPSVLSREISTTVEYGTVLVSIVVSDQSAQRAVMIAESVIKNYNEVINSVDIKKGQDSPVTVSTMESPSVPTSPTSPKIGLNIVAALFAGLLLGIALAALRDLLDGTVKSKADLLQANLPSLGSIPIRSKDRQKGNELIDSGEHTPTAEAFRQLRTNLQFASLDRSPRKLLVTSSGPGEGKSFVSANLAAVYAATGMRVALVDLDLRRPVLAERLGLEKSVGVTSVLLGRATLEQALQPIDHTNIELLASGPLPPNPADVLSTLTLAEMLDKLAASYDIVILDTPPAGMFADARQLATIVDGAIVVSRQKHSKTASLAEVVNGLRDVGGNVLGVLINASKVQSRSEYDQYGYNGYRTDKTEKNARARTKHYKS